MARFDATPPITVAWDSVVVRRTIDRKTGVVMAEEAVWSLNASQKNRPLKGESPKEILTVFFSWEDTPTVQAMSYVEVETRKDMRQSLRKSCKSMQRTSDSFLGQLRGRPLEMGLGQLPMALILQMQLVENQANM